MRLDFPIIDLHTHLRNDIAKHTKNAKSCGISAVLYMANCNPPLDNLARIKNSIKQKRNCIAIPISAITKNLEGEELVEIGKISPYVAGFSDDGHYLKNLNLLKEILKTNVLVLAHCCPDYKISLKKPYLETEYVKKYLDVLSKIGGKLHIQHISKKSTVKLIREAKKEGIKITCETCPHYFTYTSSDLAVMVNPPLGTEEDILEIKSGLKDGTIDVIASDYAPLPRKTGIAGFRSFIALAFGLILEGVLNKKQLKEKLYLNPKKIIESSGYKFNL